MGQETLAKTKKQASLWWMEDDRSSGKRSTWLQSTISALNGKTKAMLKLIEEDADSFAQRAEMYYKKRPELISLVVDFYRAHRSLAERYDLVKSEPGSRLIKSPLFTTKYNSEKLIMCTSDRHSVCSYDTSYSLEESTESEVDDPEPEDDDETRVSDIQVQEEEEVEQGAEDEDVSSSSSSSLEDEEVKRLTEEVERLKEANMNQRAQLEQKDEEKREAIRQLSMTVEVLKQDNVKLRRLI